MSNYVVGVLTETRKVCRRRERKETLVTFVRNEMSRVSEMLYSLYLSILFRSLCFRANHTNENNASTRPSEDFTKLAIAKSTSLPLTFSRSSISAQMSRFDLPIVPDTVTIIGGGKRDSSAPAAPLTPELEKSVQEFWDRLSKAEPKASPYIHKAPNERLTTSFSTPSSSGPCLVCGKECSQKCSSCAENGTKWMYFCSKEHQKLVSTVPSITAKKG